jgi:hypothetical protein
MDLLPMFLVVVAATVGYIVWVSRADAGRAVRRKARRTRNVPIATVKHGEIVKVTGVVGALDPLTKSPVGEQPCIGFRIVAVAHNRSERSDSAPVSKVGETREGAQCGRFTILDETGTALAEGPFMVGLDLEGEWSIPITDFKSLRGTGLEGLELSGAWAFSCREGLLKPGDRVSVVGRAVVEPDPTSGSLASRTPRTVVCLRGSAAEPIVLVDAGRGDAG